jgi:phosphoribosyl 1,2-cyclic phosphate phosphodiesterase
MLGVRYPESFLANSKNHRTRSSVLLQGPTGNFLVDCTPELRLQLVRENIFDVDSVLITHTHADHIMGMDDLRSFCIRDQRAIPVYARPEHQEDIKRIFPYAFGEYPPQIFVPRFDLMPVPEKLNVVGLELTMFAVDHGKVKVNAFRVNNFAYITDVSWIPEESIALLQNLDVLVLDAVRHQPHPNHYHFDRAIETAQRLGAITTYLTHLGHDYDHDVDEPNLPPGIKFAFDGLKIPL